MIFALLMLQYYNFSSLVNMEMIERQEKGNTMMYEFFDTGVKIRTIKFSEEAEIVKMIFSKYVDGD